MIDAVVLILNTCVVHACFSCSAAWRRSKLAAHCSGIAADATIAYGEGLTVVHPKYV
jgi:hypothetical protein